MILLFSDVFVDDLVVDLEGPFTLRNDPTIGSLRMRSYDYYNEGCKERYLKVRFRVMREGKTWESISSGWSENLENRLTFCKAHPNLVPRSPTVIRKRDLVKFDFEHAQCQRGPKYGLFYHCACSYSLL